MLFKHPSPIRTIYLGIIKNLVFIILLLFILLNTCVTATAQNIENLGDIKVEELTDDQIRKFIIDADKMGMGDDQVEVIALQKGMNPIELVKFKNRIQTIRKAIKSLGSITPTIVSSNNGMPKDAFLLEEQKPVNDFNSIFTSLKMANFGADVFNNPKITFEPNLKMPTPANYQLAADDEIHIDVSGYSEANYKLKVSSEGLLRIPGAGPVMVNGLTMEEAKRVIVKKLSSTIYSNIRSGHTHVDIALGAIRSIRITIIGEATMPGAYTLPSLASAYNALYACGGPNLYGCFRNIQVIRNNAIVAVIDVYQYLLNGQKKSDIRLMDQDVIKINPYSVRVELKGEIKKPGLYDVMPGESVSELIGYAGGFTDNAYTAKIQAYKNTNKERVVTTVTEKQITTIFPKRGDTYIIGKILNRFSNRISVMGAVYRPGEYELKPGMTLKQIIEEADGLREDAFTSRASIHRLKADLSPEIIAVDVDKLLQGEIDDIKLRREDRIHIFSKFDLKEGYYIKIEGEVLAPGTFMYEDGLRVQDVILMAGGMKESASMQRVEISRRIKDADPKKTNTKTALIFQQDIPSGLRDTSLLAQFTLLPFDEITVRPAPGYSVQKNVVIEGEVIYTGKYTLEAKKDRISDLVRRAGGLTPEAYLTGAVLVRSRNLTKTEQANLQQGLSNLIKQNYQAGTATPLLEYTYSTVVEKKSESVGINLRKILENPASKFDLLLNDGDTLRIPKQLQTVRVNGEVLYPNLIRYDKKYSFKNYIISAGGFSDRSSKKKSYAVYANGSVKGTKSFLFFKNYPSILPGTEIYVPVKREKERLKTGEIMTVGATVVSLLAILFNVFVKK